MKIKKIKPNEALRLSYKELELFYQNLLICESHKRLGGYRWNDKSLKQLITDKKITPTYNKTQKEWTEISRESEYNEIQFRHNRSNICASLLVHLRNSFAHGYIEKDAKTGVLHFQDVYERKCNMDGKMTFETLSSLINAMYKTKNKRNDEKQNL